MFSRDNLVLIINKLFSKQRTENPRVGSSILPLATILESITGLGYSVQYLCVPRFLEELTIAHADGSYGKLLVQLAKKDLIILDDFGMAPALTPQQHRDLFNLIDDRHQTKSTLITSQLPVKNWHDYIGEPTTADAILDRLLHNTQRIELIGESLRKNKSIASS